MASEDPIRSAVYLALGTDVVERHGWIVWRSPEREQGWKLHVSATITSAPDVLQRVLPLLRDAGAPFKVAASIPDLRGLNEGSAGLSQVGKFITIYPADDDQAVSLAQRLDAATVGLAGPRIPSDRPLRPQGLVHYRYGGFLGLEMTDSLGQTMPALRDPDGVLVPDTRAPQFTPPAWVDDPFVLAQIVELPPEPTSPLFAGYLILSVLRQGSKGGTYLALDIHTQPPRVCVLKEGRRHLGVDLTGRDIQDRLRHQYALLGTFSDLDEFPAVYDLFEYEYNLYLVMEYVEGETLQARITTQQHRGGLTHCEDLIRIGHAVASAVQQMHDLGWIFRDLTPANVMLRPDGRPCLLDLELAHHDADTSPAYGWGTPGYTSPQQARGERPTARDDIYSLGATLYFLATGSDPGLVSAAPDERASAICLLNPAIPPALAREIAMCMHPDADQRPPRMDMLAARLSEHAHRSDAASRGRRLASVPGIQREQYLQLARGAGDLLCASATRDGDGVSWQTLRESDRSAAVASFHLAAMPRVASPNLHNGVAGISLFLAELGVRTREARYLETAHAAARWLTRREFGARSSPGLHFGVAGVAAALCQVARMTGDDTLRAQAVALAPSSLLDVAVHPDMTHGWAGIGLLYLLLASETGDARFIEYARTAGDRLVATAVDFGNGIAWRHPAGPHAGMSGEILTGFAHGTAGIAYFLLELWRATPEAHYRTAVERATRWLLDLAEPSLDDASGLNWPLAADQAPDSERWFYWCHGAAGIGIFLLRAWEVLGDESSRAAALRVAQTVAVAGRRGGGTLCHGVAGNGVLLLDTYQVTRDAAWLRAAADFGDLLALYARPTPQGIAWPSEHPAVIVPDYMVGYAGVGAFMLRLAFPEQRRDPLRLPVA